jgi:hypothetical protein
MAIHREVGWETPQADILARLLRERGIDRYGLFLVSGEGKQLTDDIEASSGYVVDAAGCIHFFWMDWDATRGRINLTRWQEVAPDPDWRDEPEYRQALELAGYRPSHRRD